METKKPPTKPEKGRQVEKIERTGDKTLVVHHENGDTFEGNVDTSKNQFDNGFLKGVGKVGKVFVVGIAPCPVCNSKWHTNCEQ